MSEKPLTLISCERGDSNFAQKRFLITQPMIQGLNGSTMVCLELAEFLQRQGCIVSVYTYFYDSPARDFFNAKNINVKAFADEPGFHLVDFDYIWVHSQVLPVSIVRELAQELPEKLPSFIFLHMSKFDWIPDEQPYIWEMEEKISAQSLAISREIIEETKNHYSKNFQLKLFPNTAPVAFSESTHIPRKDLQRILIASNHPPEEIVAMREILAARGVETTLLGETGEEYKVITPDFLAKFDVVVTIGKTVQYCLAMNVPVYIYDWFGGGGYLSEKNFAEALGSNFSGRDCPTRKDPESLVDDIISQYVAAVKYQTENRAQFVSDFSIDQALPRTLTNIEPREIERFNIKYMNMVLNCQRLSQQRFEFGSHLWNRDHEMRKLREEAERRNEKFREVSDLNEKLYREVKELQDSEALKIGRLILKPASLMKRGIRKLFRIIRDNKETSQK